MYTAIYIYIHSYILWYKSLKTPNIHPMFLAFFWFSNIGYVPFPQIPSFTTSRMTWISVSASILCPLWAPCAAVGRFWKKTACWFSYLGEHVTLPRKKWGKTYLYTWHHWRFPVSLCGCFSINKKEEPRPGAVPATFHKNLVRVKVTHKNMKLYSQRSEIPKNLE